MRKSHYHFKTHECDEKGNIYKIGCDSPHINNKKYIYLNDGKSRQVRRWIFIWECFNGKLEEGKIVKHKNDNELDNSLENLYVCDKSFKMNRRDSKKIIAKTEGKEITYNSIYSCSKDLNISSGNIHNVLNSKGGYLTSKKDNLRYTFILP